MERSTTWLKRLAGLAIILTLLVLVDFDQVTQRLRDARLGWLAAAALALVTATLVGAGSLYLLLNDPQRPPLRRFIPLFWLSWAVGLVIPGQVGDMAMIAAGLRRRGYEWHTAVGRNLVDKGVSLTVVAACALSGLFLWLDPRAALTILAGVTASAILTGLAMGGLAKRALDGAPSPRHRPLRFLQQVLAEVASAARRSPGRILANLVLTTVKFGLIVSAYGAALRAMGAAPVAADDLAATVAASSLAAYIPLSPNGLGTAEAVGIALFGNLGVSVSAVLAAYLALRVLVLSLAWLPVGLWFLTTTLRRA